MAKLHPIIQDLDLIRRHQGISGQDFSLAAGRTRDRWSRFHHGHVKASLLFTLDKFADIVGYELVLRKKREDKRSAPTPTEECSNAIR